MRGKVLLSFNFRYFYFSILLGGLFFIAAPLPSMAVDYRSPELKIFEMRKKGMQELVQGSFDVFETTHEGGGAVALGDLYGDGTKEIIVGAGPGRAPAIKVFSPSGILLSEFFAYQEQLRVGINVAAGDLDADGVEEIVVAPAKGGGPHVRIFDRAGNPKFTPGFSAYDENFRGGVNVAVGNVDGKGGEEIITGAGPGGGPHVRVFDRFGNFRMDVVPFASSDRGGVAVAIANVDGGREEEIITAINSFGQPWVKVYKANAQKTILGEFLAYASDFRGGVIVAGADVDKDGVEEVITSTRQGGGPHIRVFEGHGELIFGGFSAYEEDFRGGVAIAAGNADDDSKAEILTMPMQKIIEGRTDLFKYIDVDISEQTLRAYRNGVKEREFLVSTGIDRYPTPLGETMVTAKIPVHDYTWTYGPNHPDNYDLRNVKYNLRFRPHYYIHYAFWHNNFGRKMSHGCVNVNLENSVWIYNWADIGTPVIIHE